MKARLIRSAAVVFGAITFFGPLLLAAPTRVVSRGTPVRAQSESTSAVSYSVEVPVVTRVVGTALFRTAIDISNNTANSVTARYQYSYNRATAAGGFFRSPIQTISLLPFDNFHSDDFVAFLGTIPGALEAGAADSSFGTLLVTFDGVPSSTGWEGTVFARTYSPNPTGAGTVAIAYPGIPLFRIREPDPGCHDPGHPARSDGGRRSAHEHRDSKYRRSRSQPARDGSARFLRRDSGKRDQRSTGREPPDDFGPGARGGPATQQYSCSGRDTRQRHRDARLCRRRQPDGFVPDDRGLRQHSGWRHPGRRLLRDEVRGYGRLRLTARRYTRFGLRPPAPMSRR